MKISMLCSGSTGNACVIEDKGTKLMIDCGGTKRHLLSSLKEINTEISELSGLLLTHGHSDHISQVKHFKNVPTYGTFEIDEYPVNVISTHESFEVGNLQITSLPLSHDFPKTVGYKIVGESTLVYITDTGYVNEKLFPEISNADYIVMECNHDPEMLMRTNRPFPTKRRIMSAEGHLSNEECTRILNDIVGDNTKDIILAHISREGNTLSLAQSIVTTGLKAKNVRVRAAEAFELIQMGDEVLD